MNARNYHIGLARVGPVEGIPLCDIVNIIMFIFYLVFCVSTVIGADHIFQKCRTPDENEGICITIFSCPRLLQLMVDSRPSARELVQKSFCNEDPTPFQVCCSMLDVENTNKSVQKMQHPQVRIKFGGTNVLVNITELEHETKLILAVKKGSRGSSFLNLVVKTKLNQTFGTTMNAMESTTVKVQSMQDPSNYDSTNGLLDTSIPHDIPDTTTENLNDLFNLVFSTTQNISVLPTTETTTTTIQVQNVLPTSEECGNLDQASEERSDYYWIAYLLNGTSNDWGYSDCNGVLISKNFVLTTSECAKIATRVLLGYDTNLNVCDQFKPQNAATIISIKEVLYMSPNENINQIVLLRLQRSVRFARYIQPICLPADSENADLSNLVVYRSWKDGHAVEDVFGKVFCRAEENGEFNMLYEGLPMMYKRNNKWFVQAIVSLVNTTLDDGSKTVNLDALNISDNVINWILTTLKAK